MATDAYALVVGDFDENAREQLALAASRGSAAATFCSTVSRALARLRGPNGRPTCVLLSSDLDVKHFIDTVREEVELFALPVLIVLARPSTEAYRDGYLAGADDVLLASDTGGLTRRIANLSLHQPDARPAATLGRALIASADEVSRRRLGRTLRQVGFDVSYATSLEEAKRLSSMQPAPAFVVTTERRQAGEGAGTKAELSGIPLLVLAPDEAVGALRAGDQVVDLTGRLLFFADEQAKARFKDRRASQRKLYATVCSFREGGSLQPVYGLSHNASREGMYVRTLDPPRPGSSIWLELSAPATGTAVHLRARAMWQRLPGAGSGVLPPGFGLRIEPEECPPADLQAFTSGYESLPE